MLKFVLIAVFVLYGFSHTSEACENPKLALNNVQLRNPIRRTDMCPPETEDQLNSLKQVAQKFTWMLGYCLFDKNFKKEEEKVCKFDLKPIFKAHEDSEKCGLKKKHWLRYFGYFYCGKNDDMRRLLEAKTKQDMRNYVKIDLPKDLNMFDVCFDKYKHETIYTTHKILNLPAYVRTPELEQESNCDCVTEISTDPFYMKQEVFLKLRDRYKLEERISSDSHFKVVPHYIVPPLHFADRTWKRATNHFINTAPLRDKLVPLMDIIDQGIKRAAISVFRATKLEELLIFTTIIKIPNTKYPGAFVNWWKKKDKKIEKHLFKQNIWCKLVVNKEQKQGIFIYVHNTREKPKESEKRCRSDLMKECNFKTWAYSTTSCEASTSTGIPNGTEIDFEYAYCCEASMADALDMFDSNLLMVDFLNIDSIINPVE
ncbi:uncharacterized protein LOC135833682 [Planococcus citri]|uniref:uncharacterized protein LOC135833682 n=1 Tax=Planococcus citri TaxID=170843 RepID=UPI0031F9C48B